MKYSPSEGSTPKHLDKSPDLAVVLPKSIVRQEVRDALAAPVLPPSVVREWQDLGRSVVDAPSVVSTPAVARYMNNARQAAGVAALGAVLPGCMASDAVVAIWDALGIWGTLGVLSAMGVGTLAALWKNGILRYETVSANAWAILEPAGALGFLRRGKTRTVTATSVWYSPWMERIMNNAEILKEEGNFPNPQEITNLIANAIPTEAKSDPQKYADAVAERGYSPALDAYLHIIETQGSPTWVSFSVKTQIVDSETGPLLYRTKFDASRDGNYAIQDRKIHDLTDSIVSNVAASFGFKTMDEVTAGRAALSEAVNKHPTLAKPFLDKFEAENGVRVTINLNNIESPLSLQKASTLIQVQEKMLAVAGVNVKIAEQEGLALKARASAEADALRLKGDAKTDVLGKRAQALGGSDEVKMLVGGIGTAGDELRGLADDLLPLLRRDPNNGPSNGNNGNPTK